MLFKKADFETELTPRVDVQINSTHNSIDYLNQNNKAMNLETKIATEFMFYTILVYFELLVSFLGLFSFIIINSPVMLVILSAISSVFMIINCVMAIIAKKKLDSRKQKITFISFSIITFLGILTIVSYLIYIKSGNTLIDANLGLSVNTIYLVGNQTLFIVGIAMIPVELILGICLIFNARQLYQLMTAREEILADISIKRSNSIAMSLTV